MSPRPKIRLYVPGAYAPGALLPLNKTQAHYLQSVMRQAPGDMVAVFNGQDGEWLAELVPQGHKAAALALKQQRAAQKTVPDVWLAFAPIKNKSDLVVEKATELGVAKLIAVFTQHAVVKSVNMEKLTAHAVEASEQCERCDVPAIDTAKDLASLLGAWPKDRPLLYGDESGTGAPLAEALRALPAGGCGLLIGPEGGFSADEHRMLRVQPFVVPFGMGPRILRADTAAVAALACLMSQRGDWREPPHFNPGASA